jgi:hypothetical protein
MGRAFPVALAATLLLTGCDKIASLGGGGADGSAPSSGSGGGLFSFLGSDFEGEITMALSEKAATKAKSMPQSVVFDIKKPKYRLDFTGMANNPQLAGGGSLILDPTVKKGYLLVHPQKMAMVIDFEKMKAMKGTPGAPSLGGPKAPSGGPSSPPPKIEKTGKKDTVAGYTCDIWNITESDGKRAEICAAEGITWFDLSDLGWSSPELTAAAAITDLNHFPLRVVVYTAAGVEETRMEAQKIEKKKLDDTRFVVPTDYKIMDLSAMMGGTMQPPGAPGAPGMAGRPGFPPNVPPKPYGH